MNRFVMASILILSSVNVLAKDLYPDAVRDRPSILQAAKLTGVEMNNLEFPLSKQVITGTITALSKIPELAGYLFGSKEGFVTLHTITFDQKGIKLTCGAAVILKPDGSTLVSVSSCGSGSVSYLSNNELIPLVRVN